MMSRVKLPGVALMGAAICLGTGCATVANYETMLQGWIGQDKRQLLAVWGPPSAVFEVDRDTSFYTWDADYGTVAVPVLTPFYTSVVTTARKCRTTFTIDARDRVAGWRHEGNQCKAFPPDSPTKEVEVAKVEAEKAPVTKRLVSEKPALPVVKPEAPSVSESESNRQYSSAANILAQRLYEEYNVDLDNLRRRETESEKERLHRLLVMESTLAKAQ